MPNWVYNNISVEKKYTEKIKQIAEKGICKHFVPEPENNDDWYNWRLKNWGVKWDASEHDVESDGDYVNYRFQTPWGVPDINIFELLAKEIPNFTYFWEEEQGYGADYECVDGTFTLLSEWDLPVWKDNGDSKKPFESCGTLSYLMEDFHKLDETYPVGYYLEYCLNTYLGKNYKDAMIEYDENYNMFFTDV